MLVRTLNTYLLSNIDNTFSIERGLKSSSGRFHTRLFACKQPVADVQQARHFFSPYLNSFLSLIAKIFFRSNSQWLKHSSGRFHTRLLVCKQPVAVVQQARRIFSHHLSQSSRILSQKKITSVYYARTEEFLWLLPHATIRLQAVGR